MPARRRPAIAAATLERPWASAYEPGAPPC